MAKKKKLDSEQEGIDTIGESSSEPKYLNPEDMHKFEVSSLEKQLREARIQINKLQSKLSEAQASKCKAEQAFYDSQRQVLLMQNTEKETAQKEWATSLRQKYDVDSIDGYNPLSGEIYTNPQ